MVELFCLLLLFPSRNCSSLGDHKHRALHISEIQSYILHGERVVRSSHNIHFFESFADLTLTLLNEAEKEALGLRSS